MGWGRYADEAAHRVAELRELLTPQDVSALQVDLARYSKGEWCEWIYNNRTLVLAFIEATPSERKRAPRFRVSDENMRYIRLAALLMANQGHALLEAMSTSMLRIGIGYRSALAEASDVADRALGVTDPFWPLDEPSPWG